MQARHQVEDVAKRHRVQVLDERGEEVVDVAAAVLQLKEQRKPAESCSFIYPQSRGGNLGPGGHLWPKEPSRPDPRTFIVVLPKPNEEGCHPDGFEEGSDPASTQQANIVYNTVYNSFPPPGRAVHQNLQPNVPPPLQTEDT